jgi:mevalonate kinase
MAMKLHGRITLFGEAFGSLIDEATFSVPTRQALKTLSQTDEIVHPGVDSSESIGRRLCELGFMTKDQLTRIDGDLPIGYGLASSTVLTLLQMRSAGYSDEVTYDAAQAVDGFTVGSPPTGADHAAILNQTSGTFGRGVWTPITFRLPDGPHLLIPPRAGKSTKVAAKRAMQDQRDQLIPLVRSLLAGIRDDGEIDLQTLLRYSRILLETDVYSQTQHALIASLLAHGIVAKGSGGMYDCAVLVFAEPEIWEGDPPFPLLRQTSHDR